MLTDLLNRFIASLTYALSVNRYGLVVPSRMLPAMQDMQKLEAEVQRLQDANEQLKAQQKSLEFYVQDSRRYRFIRLHRNRDEFAFCRGLELDSYIDRIIGEKSRIFTGCTFVVGKPVVELPIELK